jgi:chromosome segregation protein
MRLESVVLKGFKSFAEKTVVRILPGVTGIVGPNGCGKSNISEAVRWALGEQSAKSLRGTRMEDLIFHGSASRKPIGLAEVELVFSNDGALAVPWSEVAVGRRLYRTGESEYLLNSEPSRLRDILDLLAGTGASSRAYSVMDQEKLNHVLTAKPYERRIFIEEAAGIARYKQQRHETQGKLDATRQNLLRVRDVMDEVKRQLGSLERQARKAQQYKVLHGERQGIALALVAADHARLRAEGERLGSERERLRADEEQLRGRLAALAATEAARRATLQETDYRLSDLRQGLQKARSEFARVLERRDQIGVQLHELRQEDVRLAEDVRLTEARIEAVAAERQAKVSGLREAEVLAGQTSLRADELQAELEVLRSAIAGDRTRLESLRLEQVRMAAERVDLTRSTGELRERESQLDRRRVRLEEELAEAQRASCALLAELTAGEAERARTLETLVWLEQEQALVASFVADCERRIALTQARLGDARVRVAARRSSLEALEQLERAREGYGAGVRAVFAAGNGARLAGVLGTVADLLDVPSGLEPAVEAVLGERLQWIVVDRFDDARGAVGYLKTSGAGAATFVPLETLPPPGEPPSTNGTVRWATRAVRATHQGLLHYLLGRVGIVDHLDEAEALWRRNGVVATYVTPGGEVLTPTGRLRGGAADAGEHDPERSLLVRKRTIRELGDEVAHLDAEIDRDAAELAAVEGELAQFRLRAAQVQQSIQAGEAERLAADKDLEQGQRERDRLRRHLDTVQGELVQVKGEREEALSTLDQLLRHIATTRHAEDVQESAMASLRQTVEDAQAREAALGAEVTASRVEAGSARERVDALGREIGHLDELRAELRQRVDGAEARRAQIGERAAWLGSERERSELQSRELAAERDDLETHERDVAGRFAELTTELQGVEADSRTAQGELSRLVNAMHDVELRATEVRVRLEELGEEARRVFSIDPATLPELHEPDRDLEASRERLAELEEKLSAMGAVNLVADEEYRELDDRLGFLKTQHDDLVGSIKDLEKALRGMTNTAQERFQQAFDEINGQFSRIFERLFEGGRAELRLVEAEEGGDPLETGVELMAQPRGKRLQAVTLMSGGERALTGLALLFAIFYFRPSPFCVLDEVDAPLDDANIHRFLRVLRELTSQTQFLVITHNRKTMEAADVLYGVTMEEPGLSKLVAVSLAGEVAARP